LTPDHPEPTADADERGVLSDSTRTDTSSLGFLSASTAQVNVSLPVTDEDDLADDDVIGDEVVIGDIDVEEVAAADSDLVDDETELEIVDAELEPDDEAEEGAATEDGADVEDAAEDAGEDEDAGATADGGATADAGVTDHWADVEQGGAIADADASQHWADVEQGGAIADADATEDGGVAETEDVTADAGEAEDRPEEPSHAAAVEPEDADATAFDPEGGDAFGSTGAGAARDRDAGDEPGREGRASALDSEGGDAAGRAAASSLRSPTVDDIVAPRRPEVARAESDTFGAAPKSGVAAGAAASRPLAADLPTSVPQGTPVGTVADDAVDAPVRAVAPVDEEADVDETRAQRAHAVERVRTRKPELNLASKRLSQFEVDTESSDLLTPDRLLEPGRLARPEPEGAWQHFVYSISGGRINLGDGKRARARKELAGRIAGPLAGGARFVPVLSRKGGVGKTTITTLLGMALADARDDRIIAIDANPDRGTLAERISRHNGKTVRDLVRMKDSVSGYNDVSTIVARDETRLDVLASDADPQVSVAFSDDDYEDVAKLAAHYYSIVLTDTGTGIVHSVMGATLGLADQLVIVAGLSVDEARLASETLTWLETNGYAAKARNAVVVLNNARPGAPLVREDELEAHFRTRVRQVVRMPYDAAIGTGSAIVFHDLQPETRQAARLLAAAVVEGLRTPAAAA